MADFAGGAAGAVWAKAAEEAQTVITALSARAPTDNVPRARAPRARPTMKDIQFLPETDSERIRRREAGRDPVPDVYNVAGGGCKLGSRDALPASLHKRAAAKPIGSGNTCENAAEVAATDLADFFGRKALFEHFAGDRIEESAVLVRPYLVGVGKRI
jgi:hypothetical protein